MEKIMVRQFIIFIFCLVLSYFSSAIADINDTEKKQGQSFENLDNEIKELKNDIKEARRILDLACGGGRHSLAMAQHGAEVTGLDIGPAAIASARRRAARERRTQGGIRHVA